MREVCIDHDVPFVLNDRPDLALAAGADGVTSARTTSPATVARQILGADAIVGLSTHSHDDLLASLDEPVDYVSAGPVTPTPTKPGRPGVGIGYVREAVARSPAAGVGHRGSVTRHRGLDGGGWGPPCGGGPLADGGG